MLPIIDRIKTIIYIKSVANIIVIVLGEVHGNTRT